MHEEILKILGNDADYLLNYRSPAISKEMLALPGSDFVDRVFSATDRSNGVLRSFQSVFGNGRLAGTGYLSILPVEKGQGTNPEELIAAAHAGHQS